MGNGRWTREAFDDYAKGRYGVSTEELERADLKTQEVFRTLSLNSLLNPRGVMRQCHDSEEHPNTVPVILALDVTGSMGKAAVKTATCLNSIMTGIFCSEEIRDVEFCVMAIGDIHYDRAPIQISQFESDIRIAEQMDAVYFEGGGGGNSYESYSAAWYMALKHCELHCWNRGRKGLIITMGDELPNPGLNAKELNRVTGDSLQADVGDASPASAGEIRGLSPVRERPLQHVQNQPVPVQSGHCLAEAAGPGALSGRGDRAVEHSDQRHRKGARQRPEQPHRRAGGQAGQMASLVNN